MADFASTKATSSFVEWFEQLSLIADLNGDSVGESSGWEDTYNAGTPVDVAYYDAFGSD
ncbi:hypothetical protein JAG53_002118 [Proteus mirabilis]|nr:hypothetical protein [Proteus mirabilis]